MTTPTLDDIAREWRELPVSYKGAIVGSFVGLAFALTGAALLWGLGGFLIGLGLSVIVLTVGFMQQ